MCVKRHKQYAKINWSETAEQEYLCILNFWKKVTKSSEYSMKIKDKVEEVEDLISLFPLTGFVVYQNERMKVRKIVILKNYSIFYEVLDDSIEILYFWDNRQNPNKLEFD